MSCCFFKKIIKNKYYNTTINCSKKISVTKSPGNHILFFFLIISKEILKNIPDTINDTTIKVINSINLSERENIGAIIPPENQATLIFPIISDARFNCLDENLFIKIIKIYRCNFVYCI